MFYDMILFENIDWYKVQFLKKYMSLGNFCLAAFFKLSDFQVLFFSFTQEWTLWKWGILCFAQSYLSHTKEKKPSLGNFFEFFCF